MAKPSDFPEWDKNETNISVPPTSRKDDGWDVISGVPEKPPYQWSNWFRNLCYKWIFWFEARILDNIIVIRTQTQFDAVFDGSTLQNKSIYIENKGSAYTLAISIPFGSNLKIDAEPGVEIQKTSALTQFVSTGTSGTPISNIYFTNTWTFDGNKGSYVFSGNGGFTEIKYVEDSIFECYVKNCKCTGNGGAYADSIGLSGKNIIIRNIDGCEANYGGGVYFVGYSKIEEVKNCVSSLDGGGLHNCGECIISNVYSNTAGTNGGGLVFCDNCTISNVYSNTATSGNGGGLAGCDNCTISNVHTNTAIQGGGLYNCDECKISHVHDNNATYTGSTTGLGGGGLSHCDDCDISHVYSNTSTWSGGGLTNCNRCNISHVYDNSSSVDGGGLHSCNNCSITYVYDNTSLAGGGLYFCSECTIKHVYANAATSGNGGGANDCPSCVFLGNWTGNSASASNNYINNSTNGITFCIGTGTTAQSVVTTRATINWN